MVTSRCFWFRVFVLGRYKSTVSLACEVRCFTFFYFFQIPSCTLFIYSFICLLFFWNLSTGWSYLIKPDRDPECACKICNQTKIIQLSESVWGEKASSEKLFLGDTDTNTQDVMKRKSNCSIFFFINQLFLAYIFWSYIHPTEKKIWKSQSICSSIHSWTTCHMWGCRSLIQL